MTDLVMTDADEVTMPLENATRAEVILAAPLARVRQALLDVSAWPGLLPSVRKVGRIYDDGSCQEFTIEREIGDRSVTVRTVRRCEPDHIAYFFPDPAPFLKHHCGAWLFEARAPESTRLVAIQSWALSAKASSWFPARDGMTTNERVAALLEGHLQATLAAWQQIFADEEP